MTIVSCNKLLTDLVIILIKVKKRRREGGKKKKKKKKNQRGGGARREGEEQGELIFLPNIATVSLFLFFILFSCSPGDSVLS